MGQSEVDAAKARTARVFGEMAAGYDQGGPGFFSHFGRRLVKLAQLSPGTRVLDIATGRGAVLIPAAGAVSPRGAVVGIDLSEPMLDALDADLKRTSVTNAELFAMDAETLDFAADSFDAVLCGFGVMFFPRLPIALAEFRRVLKPGGTLGVSTFATQPLTIAIAPVMGVYQQPIHRTLTQELSTPAELRDALEGAGFENLAIHAETFEAIHPDEDAYWAWAMSLLPGVWYKAQPPEIQAQFKDDIFAHLQSIRQPDGIHESITALFAIAEK